MSDPTPSPRHRVPVRDAFAALAVEPPPRSAWPALAARVQSARPRRRAPALWWAVAASALLVAILVPRLAAPPDVGPATGPDEASSAHALPDPAGLAALQRQSQALESRLQRTAPALRSGDAVLAGEWITADIGAIDAALAVAPPGDAEALWQARVVLLAELAGLRQHEAIAAAGAGGLVPILD